MDKEDFYVMETGILRNNLEFQKGKHYKFIYDFEHKSFSELVRKFKLKHEGESEFETALRLMSEFSLRLTHESDYDNHVAMNALDLIEYSLDNKTHGINCRSKAQILNEMCLALGLYARKVWLMPYSLYDNDCHVVNEVWDSKLEKWVMLDITNNEYWVDDRRTPLSILEIRAKAAINDFCTPVKPYSDLSDLQKIKEELIDDFLYICKNIVYMEYCAEYSVGENNNTYLLLPKHMEARHDKIISIDAIKRSPLK